MLEKESAAIAANAADDLFEIISEFGGGFCDLDTATRSPQAQDYPARPASGLDLAQRPFSKPALRY
jgi:hypothetical protein